MQKLFVRGFAVALAMAVAAPLGTYSAMAASDLDPIKVRQAMMKQNFANFRGVQSFLKGGRRAGTADTVVLRGESIASIADRLPAMFPKGTGLDKKGLKATRAKPAIWRQWDDFKAAAANLKKLAVELSEVAKGGDKAAIKVAMGKLDKEGCTGCHRNFRQSRPRKK